GIVSDDIAARGLRVRLVHPQSQQIRQRKTEAVQLLQRRSPALQDLRIDRGGRSDRNHFAAPGRIKGERGKHLAERLDGGSIKLATVVHVEGSGAAGSETLFDQAIELARQEMERHISAAIGIEQNQIVALAVAGEENAAVAREVAYALALAQAEIG